MTDASQRKTQKRTARIDLEWEESSRMWVVKGQYVDPNGNVRQLGFSKTPNAISLGELAKVQASYITAYDYDPVTINEELRAATGAGGRHDA